MSTLNTQNITNGTDSITVEGAVKGSAKAWVNFDGTSTVTIRAAYNVSSITDNGTGDYTVTFTTAMVDANYATLAVSGYTGASNWSVSTQSTQTTTSTRVRNRNVYSNYQEDAPVVSVAVFR